MSKSPSRFLIFVVAIVAFVVGANGLIKSVTAARADAPSVELITPKLRSYGVPPNMAFWSKSRLDAASHSVFSDPTKETFGFMSPLTLNYSVAVGGTLDFAPVSSIIPTSPAGMDRMVVNFPGAASVSHGTIYRFTTLTAVPWGTGPPTSFQAGYPNNVVFGGEGFRYTNDGTGANTSETIPVIFRDGTGFTTLSTSIVILIDPTLVPPTITTQPNTLIRIPSGSTATMTVVGNDQGHPPLTYQWYTGFAPDLSNPIAGATNASYTTPVLSTIQQYHYFVRVTNPGGGVNSDGVTVQVETPTSVTTANAATSYGSANHNINLNASATAVGVVPLNQGAVQYTSFPLSIISVQSGTVSNGVAPATAVTIPGGSAAGVYPFEAKFIGPAGFADSFDTSKTITINPASTVTTTSNASVVASASDQVKTLSATVTSAFGAVGEGTVTFTVKRGAATVGVPVTSGTVSGNNASANFTVPGGTAAGTLTVQAVYNPSSNYLTSSDVGHTLSVQPVITTSTAAMPIGQTSLVINGFGFDSTIANNSLSFSNGTGTITAASFTQLTVSSVTGLVPGALNTIITTNGVATSSTQVATVFAPPTISKAFSPGSIFVGGTFSQLTFTISNPNGSGTLTGVSFNDLLPSGLQVDSAPGVVVSNCGGSTNTSSFTAGATSLTVSNASVTVGTNCTINVNVIGTTPGVKNNTTGAITSTEGGTGTTSNTATLNVFTAPQITKSFGASTLPVNGTTTVTFVITNPAANPGALTTITFIDSLPVGMVVVNPPVPSNTCSGSVTAVNGSGTISLGGASIATPGNTCQVQATVQVTTAGVKNNSVTVSSGNGGTGNTANATVTVANPPTITKSFGAAAIAVGGNINLDFAITNPASNGISLTGVAATDNLPAGLVVASPNGLTGSCGGGTITATPGSGSVTLTGATLTSGTTCNYSVQVTGTTAGVKNNSVSVTSTESGAGTNGTANITVIAPPTVSKAFGTASIPLNGVTSLTFTVTNPNTASGLSGVNLLDNMPAGLRVAGTPNITGSCGGGTIGAIAGSNSITLTGGSLTASPGVGSTCTFSADVTGTTAGTKANTTNAITSTEGGTGTTSNTANLNVEAPPYIQKSFASCITAPSGMAGWYPGDGNSNDIQNGNNGTNTGSVGFAAGKVGQAFDFNGSNSIDIGSPAALKLAGGVTLDAWVRPTALPAAGQLVGVVTKWNQNFSIGNATDSYSLWLQNNSGTLRVFAGVHLADGSEPIIAGGVVPLNTFTHVALSYNNVTGVETIYVNGQPVFTTNVTPQGIIGVDSNVGIGREQSGQSRFFTGQIDEVEIFNRGLSNEEILSIFNAGANGKCKTAPGAGLNVPTPLTFTITNPAANAQALTGVAFTDTLPAGLVVSTPNGLSGSCGGGTITATAGSGSISLSGATIATGGSCTFSVNVTGTASGPYTNTVGVTSTNGGNGNTATALLSVAPPPSIAKSFGAATIPLNTSTSLTFNIANTAAGAVSLTGIGFTDNLPAGLVVATPNGLTTTCNGTQTAVAGSGSVSLSAATLAANASCSVTVNVTGTVAGVKNNSVQVTSTEGGNGNTSNASITVVAPPTISKAFGAASIPLGGSTSLTFTLNNPNATVGLTGVAFSDSLPSGLVVASPNGLTTNGNCGGGASVTAVAGSGTVSLTGGAITTGAPTCTITVNVTGTAPGTKNNTTGAVTSTEGGTGTTSNTATIDVLAPPTIAKAFGASNITLNGTTTLTFTLTNPSPNALALTGVAFSDTFPAGLVVGTPNGLTTNGNCGAPSITATAGTGSVTFSNGTIAVGATCSATVNVTGTTSGIKVNTTGTVSSTNGGTGGTASATIAVAIPPTVSKAFGAASIPLGTSTSLTLTINNPNSALALTGIAVSDALPAGLVVATPNNLNNTCNGTATATAGSGTLSLSGGTLAANSSCTIIVNVTGTTAGVKSNTTGVISSAESGPGTTSNTVNLTVVAPPGFSKSFGAASIPLNGGVTSLSFTVTNSNTTTTLTGVGFTDTLPAGLIVATPNGLAGTCGGGTITAAAGSGVVSLANASLAQNTNCTFSVNVTGTTAGTKNNVTTNITSVEGGNGTTATASIAVVAPPVIAKVFNPNLIPLNGTTSLDFTITNPAANSVALTGVAFTDVLPSGLTIVDSTTGVCGGTRTTTAATRTITLAGATIATNSTCTFSVTVTGAVAGPYTNTTGAVTSTNGGTGNTATANLTVDSPPTAVANTTNITSAPGSLYTFTVTYTDDFGVNVSTLDSNDVRVTGPGGYNAAATFTGVNINTTGTPRTATYTIVPPGGGWDIGDNGTYTVQMQANQVNDTANQPVAAGPIGSFTVNIPPVSIGGKIRQYITGGPGDPPLANVTVTISSPNVPVPASTTTNASGDFSFTGLSSGGTYVLTPSGFGKVYDPITRTYPSLAANVANANFVAYDPNAIPRILSIPTSFAVPGQPVDVPVVMTSQGTETFVAFSLSYDINPFATPPTVACGASAPGCTVTRDISQLGKVGVTVTMATPLNAGPREVVRLTFQSLPTNLSNTSMTFGDAPVVRSVRDGSNNPLPFTTADGLVVFVQGLEGDLANRKTGDGQLLPGDVTIERQFVVGSILPDPAFNEFQRADTAPSVTKGDGQLDATDIVQERRYVAGLDAPQSAGGLGGPPAPPLGPVPPEGESRAAAAGKTMRVVSANASPGGKATIAVELDDQSGTVGASFTLNFDPSKLSNPHVELASDAASDTVLTVNASQAADGKVGILVDSSVALAKRVVTITFDVAASAGGETPLTFTDDLAHRGVSDADGGSVTTAYEDGKVTISGAASTGYRISGRVTTPEGNPLRNASVSITGPDGALRTVTTSSFGYYEFDGVAAGTGYTVAVASRRYRFATRSVNVGSDLADLDFTAQE